MQLLPAHHRESWLVVITTLALVLYGVLQERVMTKGWGPQQELFTYSSFLVLSNRLLTVAVLISHSALSGHTFIPVAPLRSYCLVSLSNMVSTLCQYEALKYVSFVAQTLAKTAKALPVVMWGTIFGGKRYSARQYAHAILITGGCSIFVLGGDITSGSAIKEAGWRSYAAGSVLLLTYLAADGWTSTQQEVLFKTHATPIREQLLYTTAFSSMYSLVATVASGQLLSAVSFLQRHPDAAVAVLTLSLASTVIQVCISTVLQRHGALMFALMMTSRQCVSVLLSTVLFGHTLSLVQWLGVAVAFSTLYHQKATSSSSRDQQYRLGRQPSMRSRLSVMTKPVHARDSDPSAPLLDAVTQGGPPAAVTQSRLAFRGSQPGINPSQVMHSIIPVAGAHPANEATLQLAGGGAGKATAAAGAAAAAAASFVPSPGLIAAMPSRLGVSCAPRPEQHLVAVVEVQAVPAGGGVGLQMMQRHAAPHNSPTYMESAGMALCVPGMGFPTPHAGSPANLSCSQAAAAALPLPGTKSEPLKPCDHLVEAGVPTGKSFDLRTLWSRGTGRVMVDPTTAVAMDHRDK